MDSDLMNEKDFNWIKSTELDESGLQSAYDIIDVLILYLSVANNPDLPDNLRAFFNEMVESYLEHNHTSLEEIYDKHFRE
jgi:flagellin-specific chaperone FliS